MRGQVLWNRGGQPVLCEDDQCRPPDAEPAAPHGGEPGMYLVENLDDADFLAKLVIQTCEELPEPKAKKKAGKAKKIHGTDNGK